MCQEVGHKLLLHCEDRIHALVADGRNETSCLVWCWFDGDEKPYQSLVTPVLHYLFEFNTPILHSMQLP